MPEAMISHKCTHQTHMLLGTKNSCNGSRPFSAYPAGVGGSVNSVQPCTLNVLRARGTRGLTCCKVCSGKTPRLHATGRILHRCFACFLRGLLFSHSIVLNFAGVADQRILQDLQAFGVRAHGLLVAQPWKVLPKLLDKKLCMGFGSRVHGKDSRRSRCLACPSLSSGRKNFKNKRLKASVHTGYFTRRACHQALVATWKQEQRLVVSSMRYEFFCLCPLRSPGKVPATSQIALRRSFTNFTQSSACVFTKHCKYQCF